MKPSSPQVILLDVGGVLVDIRITETLVALSGDVLQPEQANRLWSQSTWVQRFCTDQCTTEEFATGIIHEFNLPVSAQDFILACAAWDRGFFPGALELLDTLRPRFFVACFSNNTVLHWPPLRETLAPRLDRCYLSHEIGLMKPDERLFQHALTDLAVDAEQILYFDDDPVYVVAGRRHGLQAYVTRGVSEVRSRLGVLGIGV